MTEPASNEIPRPFICAEYINSAGHTVEVLAVCDGYVVCDYEQVFTRQEFHDQFSLMGERVYESR